MRRIPPGPERDRIVDEMLKRRALQIEIAERIGVSNQRVNQIVNERRGLCACGKRPVIGKRCASHAAKWEKISEKWKKPQTSGMLD